MSDTDTVPRGLTRKGSIYFYIHQHLNQFTAQPLEVQLQVES